MSKLSFFFTTLIAAVPAAFLGYLCVAAFLFHSDSLPPILMGIAGITLLLCVAVVAMPAYVLIKSGNRAEPPAEKPAEAESEEVVVTDEEMASSDAVEANATDEDEDVFVEDHGDDFDDFDEKSK